MSVAITIDQVTKCYRQGSKSMAVIKGLSLAIQARQFISIMGPSGSGKSTLLNLIAGLDTPDAGRILIDDQDIASLTDDERSDFRLARMGFVFQGFNLLPTFTIEENVTWPLELLRRPRREAAMRARSALNLVQLPAEVLHRRPRELSGGEQQRAAIARALVTEPQLVLADEPTGNLDSRTGQHVLDLLRRLNRERGLTVVMVTHDALAATHGDRTIEIQDGAIVRDVRAPIRAADVVPIRS
jgi:ABC-type lipoprotein export system ATPase subunit